MTKNTYPWDRIDALTSQQYRDALLDLEDEHKITEEQQRILCIHCQARHRTITAKQLARAVPFKGYQAVNAQYGRLARRLWKHLALPAPTKVRPRYGRWIGLLGSGPVHPGREWEMTMHRSLAEALKRLKQMGWCGNRQGRNGVNRAEPDGPRPHPVRGGGWRIGEAEQNARVEQAAVDAVTRAYRLRGWAVKSKEAEKPGYDLLCSRGPVVHHVEVKGISGPTCSFNITANEKRKADVDLAFRLIAVTYALNSKRRELSRFTGSELLRKFRFVPLSYSARLR